MLLGGRLHDDFNEITGTDGTVLTINGGSFFIKQPAGNGKDHNYVPNCYNENYENGTAKITVCGGIFEKFNLAADDSAPESDQIPCI